MMEDNRPERIMIKKKRKKSRFIIHICAFVIIAAISGAISSLIVVKEVIKENKFDEKSNYSEQMLNKAITNASYSIVTISDTSDKLKVNTKAKGNVSGIVVDKQGYIATSLSKIKDMKNIFVKFPSLAKEAVRADLIGGDKKTDVALIKVDSHEVIPIVINEDELKEGNFVFAAGNSISNDFIGMITVGIVTSTEKITHDEINGDSYKKIQTSTIINDENVGGALCNMQGELVGFNSVSFNTEGNDQLYYSLNARGFKDVIDYLIKFTDKLGISGELIDDQDSGVRGFYVKNVAPESQAAKWGIFPTDIILTVDTIEISSLEGINEIIRSKQTGEKIECEILRDGVNTRIQVFNN